MSYKLLDTISLIAPQYQLDPVFCTAVAMVEGGGIFFNPVHNYPPVKFEKTVMVRYMRKKQIYVQQIPEIEDMSSKGYYNYRKALALDPHIAKLSTGFGTFFMMGYNHGLCGYPTVEDFVTAMETSSDAQIEAFCRFCIADNLSEFVNKADINKFSCAYNNPAYAKHNYDRRLKAAYDVLKRVAV